MKGKIILTFVFALLALALIGFVGQNTLTELIVSIRKDSEPNQKLIALDEILVNLSHAENSVRTYTITREPENLTPFYESITTIDTKLEKLYELVNNKEQLLLLDSMQVLIELKYGTLKELIDIKKDQDTDEILERVRENIANLREKDSIPNLITSNGGIQSGSHSDRIKKVEIPERQKPKKKTSIFQRIFGGGSSSETKAEDASDANQDEIKNLIADADTVSASHGDSLTKRTGFSTNDLNSADIGQIISKISRERSANLRAEREQELELTLRDNKLMQKLRKVTKRFDEREQKVSFQRAQEAEKSKNKAIDIINITWVVALLIFATLLFIIFSDITRNQRNKERLKLAKERAEKLARVKEDFLSNMSHEIRTPLNSIIGYTEQLQGSPLTEDQQKYLTSIHRSGDHLLGIINDILDYTKLESGRLSLESIGFNIVKNTQEVIEIFQNQIEKKELLVQMKCAEGLPQVVMGDPTRFRQILINLMSNAIKFTPSGKIDIEIEPQQIDENQVTVQIKVADSGVGIPKEKLDSVFKNFAQADTSITRKYGGTGLGLSIIKKIVGLHNGTVKVESEEGKGTTFTVELKYLIGKAENLTDIPKAAITSYDKLEGKKIMVVDDQEYNLELIKVIFDKWKVEGCYLSSGKEAIDMLKTQPFDLILMDIQMPEMSGLEATSAIRQWEQERDQKNTIIVALTAATSKDEAEECLKSGMDGYLLKPFTQYSLYLKLMEMLGIAEKEVGLEVMEPTTSEAQMIDLNDLHRLSNGKPEFVVNMLNIFIKNIDVDLADLSSGMNSKNWTTLRNKSHKMIPPCRHLGLNDLANDLIALQKESENGQDIEKVTALVKNINYYYKKIKPVILEEIIKIENDLTKSVA